MFLPSEVADQLSMPAGASPVSTVRTLGDVNGAAGEAYVMAVPPLFVVVSRRLGSEWQTMEHELAEVSDLRMAGSSPALRLVWSVAERDYDVAIPSYEVAAAEKLCDAWLAGRHRAGRDLGTKSAPKPTADDSASIAEELTPVLALSASLQAMLQVDRQACDEELRLVERLIERPAMVERGAALLRTIGVEGLLERLGEGVLDESQKQCLLANLYEMAMVDGRLRSVELSLLERFREVLGLDREQCEVLERILRTKNDLSVFSY